MSVKEFRLDAKSAGAQALEGLWGPGPPGDLLFDVSAKGRGRGNHATRVGAGARTQMSDRGRVLLFNGVNDLWETERSLEINADPFTLMAWVWLDTTVPTNLAAMLGSGFTAVAEWIFYVTPSTGGVPCRLWALGENGPISAAAALGTFDSAKDNWTHVAWTRTAGAVAYVYQNGIQVATDATAGSNLSTAKALQIGCADTNLLCWWKGMIDDVRYYRRALSIGEITHIYRTTRWTPYADILLRPTRRYLQRHRAEVL